MAQLYPLTEPLFADHADGMSTQIHRVTPGIQPKPIPGHLLDAQRRFMAAAADKLHGKILVHGLNFRDWIEEATIYERLKLTDYLEEAQNACDDTLRNKWRSKAHAYIRDLAQMIEYRTSGSQAFR